MSEKEAGKSILEPDPSGHIAEGITSHFKHLCELTPSQRGRILDCVGLLGAISQGKIRSSRRIRDSLIEVLDSIDPQQVLSDGAKKLLAQCEDAILATGIAGFSVEADQREKTERRAAGRGFP